MFKSKAKLAKTVMADRYYFKDKNNTKNYDDKLGNKLNTSRLTLNWATFGITLKIFFQSHIYEIILKNE